jgi:hypothetical protein
MYTRRQTNIKEKERIEALECDGHSRRRLGMAAALPNASSSGIIAMPQLDVMV